MANKDFLSEQKEKKRSTTQGIVVMVLFIVIFMSVIFRLAFRSSDLDQSFTPAMPKGNDAYQIAKDFVKPSIKYDDAKFGDGFQLAQNSDSVYVVSSYFDAKTRNGRDKKTNFKVTIQYKGGSVSNDRNWKLVRFEED